ncbi:unnamed protein product [Symbiodinium sp. KB8]|nr:unnamed protein product [Symbiodinium sp. KB8]
MWSTFMITLLFMQQAAFCGNDNFIGLMNEGPSVCGNSTRVETHDLTSEASELLAETTWRAHGTQELNRQILEGKKQRRLIDEATVCDCSHRPSTNPAKPLPKADEPPPISEA